MKYRKPIVALFVLGPLAWFLFLVAPGGGGILARLDLGDGQRVMVIQEWSHWSEPYEVGFWYQPSPGALWKWEYLAHQDLRWSSASLEYEKESNSISIYKGSQLKAVLFLDDRMYETYGGQGEGEKRKRRLDEAWPSRQPSRVWNGS